MFTPCGESCAQVDMSGPGAAQRATARYIKLDWIIDAHSNAAVQCGDGTFVPGTAHYSWNPDTLQGRYWSTADSRPCGNDESLDTYPVPLTLTKAAPKAARPIAKRDTLNAKLLRQRPFEGDVCSAGRSCTQVWRPS
ncbi:hypothetical protein A5658_22050 [Mycobacterium sp. 1245111.1]|nr:hypothetical protein A5658_22050 [Mycobacterium sp. 1245111.1]